MTRKSLVFLVVAVCIGAVCAPYASAQERQVSRSSWGAIKALYRGNERQPQTQQPDAISQKPGVTPMNAQDWRGGPFPGGDWSSRIVWEARYALSRRADGSSAVPVYRDASRTLVREFYGDWDYVSSDTYARDKAMAEARQQYGDHWPGPFNGHFAGGTCTWFVRDVLYRATYWAGYGWHVTTPGFPSSVWSWTSSCCMIQNYGSAKPGWVISSPYNHMAILEARAWDFGGWGWWVIDSNWVGGKGNEFIGKHFMLDTRLKADNYWAWCPTWATTN